MHTGLSFRFQRTASAARTVARVLFATFFVLGASAGRADPPPTPITIPLQIVNLGTPSSPEYKLGIYVGLGGGAPKLYEFDTGAAGLFAAYDPPNTPWWTSFTDLQQPLTMSYASGIQYNANVTTTSVSLYGSNALGAVPLASVTTNVGQIESAVGSKVTNWNQDLANGQAPLYGHFYGDFGMALYRNEGNTPVPPIPDPDTNPSLYAIIPQLGSNTSILGNGFIIHMGDYNNPTPWVQIGITDADRLRFHDTVDMNAPSGLTAPGTFPNGGGPTYSQQIISGNLVLNGGEPSETVNFLGAVLDTGAPSTEVHVYGNVTVPDTIDHVSFNGTNSEGTQTLTLMHYTAGDEQGLNFISTTTNTNPLFPTQGYVNTGLNIFFEHDVMFDLEHSRVGFASPVPEPGVSALLAGAGVFSFGVIRRWRKAARK